MSTYETIANNNCLLLSLLSFFAREDAMILIVWQTEPLKDYKSSNNRTGSSSNSLTFTRKVTEVLPSTTR